tara:strand:+ start:187 stop:363 length:177 start_codon:yes stop_codon:yes gene_type:complete
MSKSTSWWHTLKNNPNVTGPTIFPKEISDKEYKNYLKDSLGVKKMPPGTKVFSEDPQA